MAIKLSVIICTYNPNLDYLNQVMQSLQQQTLPQNNWELIVVDNNSDVSIKDLIDLSWHPESSIIVEEELGLIKARIRGTMEAKNEILVSVDDDTPLYPDYLEHVQSIYEKHPELGVIGGKTVPKYETPPPDWLNNFNSLLAIRDLGDTAIIDLIATEKIVNYPACAPLLIAPRKSCMIKYLNYYSSNEISSQLGRKGKELSSGEDNDINLFIYKSGYALGYFPELKFIHIIPSYRMKKKYLSSLNYSSNKSWIKLLNAHHICPWKPIAAWTVSLRKIKAWVSYKAWYSPANYIKWRGACGMFESLAKLK